MELKILIYIVIGVVYVLSKVLKKSGGSATEIPDAGQPSQTPTTQRSTTTSQPQKTLTFEELLREITEGKKVEDKPQPSYKPVYTPYVEEEDEVKSLEEIPTYTYAKKAAVYEEYEEARKIAFNRPSLEETAKLSDTDVTFGKFKAFEEEKQPDFLSDYMKDLSDPEGFRKAFVMSEILNRKY